MTKTDAEILCSVNGNVATITFNRPSRLNAFTISMFDQLHAALEEMDRSPDVRLVVLTGAGRGFCSGGDVADIGQASRDLGFDQRVERLRRWSRIPQLIRNSSKVVLAAMNGPAAGMGFALALACDLRIAASSAKSATSFLSVGFSGDFGGPYFLSRLIGSARARQLYMMAEVIDAHEAHELGLVNWLVSDEGFQEELARVANRLAGSAPLALAYMKRNFNLAEQLDLSAYFDAEAMHQVRTGMSEDAREAQAALKEKRQPNFRRC